MLLKGESHDPCGQLWRNYSHPALQGEGGKFVSGFDRGQISLDVESDFLVRVEKTTGQTKIWGPPNKRRRLVHKYTQNRATGRPPLYLAPHKTRSRFCGREETGGITKRTVLCPLLYREIGPFKRYYESVLPFVLTIPWNHESILLTIQVRRFPSQTKSNWTVDIDPNCFQQRWGTPFDVSIYLLGNILIPWRNFYSTSFDSIFEEKNEFLFEFRELTRYTSIDFSWMERIIGIYYLKIEEKYGQF